jgi:hypothetical protein
MQYLRRFVAGFPPRSPGFASRKVHVGFVVDKVALVQVFLLDVRLSPVNIIPSMLHTYSRGLIIWGMEKGPLETEFHA